jgi:hypothetical protein
MKGLSPEEQRDLMLSVGIHKRERILSPIEVAVLMEKTINAGSTIREISEEITLDPTMVARFLRLLNLVPEIRHHISWGDRSHISFSVASEIARLSIPRDQEFLGNATLKHQLSKSEVIETIQTMNKFGKPVEQCVDEVLQIRPQVIKRYLFIGTIKSPELQKRLSEMSQRERDILFENVIASNLPDLPSWNGSLGTTRFTLMGNEALDQALSRLPTDFASSINHYLESSIT